MTYALPVPLGRQHELEADHFAAAVLLRSRVPATALGEGLHAIRGMCIRRATADLPLLLQLARRLDGAAGSRAGGPTEEQRLLQAMQDPDQLDYLVVRWMALEAHKTEHARLQGQLEELAESGILADADCMAWAIAPAISTAMAQRKTHPPMLARIERLRQLGTRTDMLLLSTAPLLTIDGRGLTPAARVADLLGAAARAEGTATLEVVAAHAGLRTSLSFALGAAVVAAAGAGLLAGRA